MQSRLSMAERGEDIAAPSASKTPVWKYFGYVMDLTTGRAAVGKRATTCKLCRVEVAHSGRMTDLKKNHLHSHHYLEYRNLYGDLAHCAEVQSQLVFYKPNHTVEKLSSSSARVQELTSATVDFVVCDLRPVNIVDSVRFLYLMKGLSPDSFLSSHC